MKLIRDKYEKFIPKEKLHKETNYDMQYNYLKAKVAEELQELLESDFNDIGEWADLHETLHAMQQFKKVDPVEILQAQQEKAEKLGAFDNFLILKSDPSVDTND